MADDFEARLRAVLTGVASRKETILYRDLAVLAEAPAPHRIHSLTLALEDVIRADHAAGQPLLAAVAVGRGAEGIPGRGFFALLRELGRYGGPDRGPEAQAAHREELQRLFGTQSTVPRIRRATPVDLPAIAAIQAASWQTAYRGMLPGSYLADEAGPELETYWRHIEIRHDDLILVAEEDTPLGFIAIWCRPEPFIDNLHVLPGHTSKGIGARLMAAAAQILLSNGHSTAHLWVMEDNTRALGFYQSLGGEAVETVEKPVFDQMAPQTKVVWNDLRHLEMLASARIGKISGGLPDRSVPPQI